LKETKKNDLENQPDKEIDPESDVPNNPALNVRGGAAIPGIMLATKRLSG